MLEAIAGLMLLAGLFASAYVGYAHYGILGALGAFFAAMLLAAIPYSFLNSTSRPGSLTQALCTGLVAAMAGTAILSAQHTFQNGPWLLGHSPEVAAREGYLQRVCTDGLEAAGSRDLTPIRPRSLYLLRSPQSLQDFRSSLPSERRADLAVEYPEVLICEDRHEWERIGLCQYTGNREIRQWRAVASFRMIHLPEGDVPSTRTIEGGRPEPCPSATGFSRDLSGSLPDWRDFVAWATP